LFLVLVIYYYILINVFFSFDAVVVYLPHFSLSLAMRLPLQYFVGCQFRKKIHGHQPLDAVQWWTVALRWASLLKGYAK
jgi:hypothetical protein